MVNSVKMLINNIKNNIIQNNNAMSFDREHNDRKQTQSLYGSKSCNYVRMCLAITRDILR